MNSIELISEVAITKWGISVQTYLFDFYLHTRTLVLIGAVVVVLRIRKVLKQKSRKR